MIAYVTSTLATAAVVVAGMFGFHLNAAEQAENPLREWQAQRALCAEPHNARTATLCELLQDEQPVPAP